MHQSLLPGKRCRLCAVKHVQLAQYIADVNFHSFFTDHQFGCDSGIRETARDETQHFQFAYAQFRKKARDLLVLVV